MISNQQLNNEYAKLKSSGFHKIVLGSFEDDDTPSEGFKCEKKFSKDYNSSNMLSKSYITGESELQTFYENGRVSKTSNTTPHTTNTTKYTYDTSGRLKSVLVSTFGNVDSATFTEERIFSYDSDNKPSEMTRMKNGRQISIIKFISDENGNIIEETPQTGNSDRKYYYYYNEKNQLTDVVHFNNIAQKLLPDFMFLYDDLGQVRQMISVDESGRNYFIWKYSYTKQGLSEIQKCYSKEKRLLGTIQFEYFQ